MTASVRRIASANSGSNVRCPVTTVLDGTQCPHCPATTLELVRQPYLLRGRGIEQCPECLCKFWPLHTYRPRRLLLGKGSCPVYLSELQDRSTPRRAALGQRESERKEVQPWWTYDN